MITRHVIDFDPIDPVEMENFKEAPGALLEKMHTLAARVGLPVKHADECEALMHALLTPHMYVDFPDDRQDREKHISFLR